MSEFKIHSTRDQIEEFKQSVIWKDMVKELMSWKRGFISESNSIVEDAAVHNHTSANVLLHVGDINGRRKAVDFLIALPDMFLSMLDSEKKDG